MTVDEALELVEIVLHYQQLNKVQELVFRQSWEGRSYKEIARSSEYEYDSIRVAGAELWKLLSKAFDQKVKKGNLRSVLKRYLQRNKVNIQKNITIEVNLSGANISGANLSGTRLIANIETEFCQADKQKVVMLDDKTELDEEILDIEEENKQEIQSSAEETIYKWNDLQFRSEAQVKIAEALDRANVLFFHNSKARLTTTEGRENQEPDFLIFHNGKWGILEVDGEVDEESDRILQSHGIPIIQHYDSTSCSEQPDRVVQEFLEILSQV